MLIVGDVYVLINYVMFTDSAFLLATVTGLLWLRWKRPNAVRPIKVKLHNNLMNSLDKQFMYLI